jgi:hypothetical protein
MSDPELVVEKCKECDKDCWGYQWNEKKQGYICLGEEMGLFGEEKEQVEFT